MQIYVNMTHMESVFMGAAAFKYLLFLPGDLNFTQSQWI